VIVITFDLDDFELAPAGPGLRVSFPVHSATGTASTASVLFELDPGAELPVHTDSAEELLIVVQGTAEARIGDEVGRLERHQVGLVPPMAPHGLRNIGDDVLRVFGTFSASTVVSTFERPFEPDGPEVFVIGAPMPLAVPLAEPVLA
jgi:quercetin dioxygenase-like cupin family protein